ncbi:MAG: GNAT family N-acetyltransferase [Robiginitomaculum sp.]|nr:MAG: GNAT family N-acetyltransferase [Robiginitomaculum sp.]
MTDIETNLRIVKASSKDLPWLEDLMGKSINILQAGFLSKSQIRASFEVMGLDTRLIEDGTYFAVWALTEMGRELAGCGGWSKRATLYGGDHSAGRSARLLDPKTEAARIRAMYTHPDWTRKGVGRLVLDTCEQAARDAGFKRAEMMATLAGVPLYEACGYTKIQTHTDTTSDGTKIPLVRMGKCLVE